MPSKLEYYKQMMETEVPRLTSSYGQWTSFLESAGRLYKYDYLDQAMIFLQKPDASACAEYDIWNKVMHRYVLRGSKGIALIDNSGSAPKLRYVFDISSTGGGRNARRPNLWQYDPQLHDQLVGDALSRAFGIPNEYGLADQTERIMVDLAENYLSDHLSEIRGIFDESDDAGYDGLRNEITFKQAVSISASYLVMSRCGLDISMIQPREFASIQEFRTLEQVNCLGNAVSQLGELVLRQIERTIKLYEREHHAERNQDHGTDLHQERRLSPAQPEASAPAGALSEQVREDAQIVPSGEQTDPVQQSGDERGAVSPSAADRQAGGADVGNADEPAAGEESGPKSDDESHGLGEAHEQSETAGGGSDPRRAGVQLSNDGDSAPSVPIPSQDEQMDTIAKAECEKPSAFNLSPDDLHDILRRGSSGNKLKIRQLYADESDAKARIAGLKQVYGISGWTMNFRDNTTGMTMFDGKGLTVTSFSKDSKVTVPWREVDKQISYLIRYGEYLTAEQQSQYNAEQDTFSLEPEGEVQHGDADIFSDLDAHDVEGRLSRLGIADEEAEPEPVYVPDPEGPPRIDGAELPWEPDGRPMEELSDEEFATRYLIPNETTFDMDGRTFMVDRVNLDFGNVNFQDITFTNETGFPIFRTEPIGFVRRVFEQMEQSQEDLLLDLPKNFRITDDHLGEGGPKAKFHANISAIRLLKDLESTDRYAAPEEQEILSRYVGWGGLADAFDPDKENWRTEYTQLREVLTPEEYSAARASTLNAHYTSPTVIRALYDALENLGFTGGNILEPSMGVGNFFGCLPDDLADSRLYGVELDSVSGRIAQKLYPQADITVAGFETTDRRDFYDLAIGNVPFGQYQVNDRAYNKLGFSIHNYFLAKAVDQVRPGGIVAFVTSRYTMDAKNSDARRYIAQRAELLGAVRLPNDAFKANAGTEVVSDILFFQKREHPIDIEPDWIHLDTTEDGFTLNSYFAEHREMILGKLAMESSPYGRDELTVKPIDGADLGQLIRDATAGFTAVYREAEIIEDDAPVVETIPAIPGVRNYSYAVVDDEVYYRENSVMRKEEVNAVGTERIKGMVALRDTLQELIRLQMEDYPEAQIQAQQEKLNAVYDAFAEKHGRLNDRANGRVFSSDSSYYLLCSLENIDDEGVFKGKADIFSKRTIRPDRKVDRVDTATEALAVSIGEHGKVDLPFMAQLMGTPGEYDAIIQGLHGVIFKDPLAGEAIEQGWQTADEYLSGNVREKLRIAELSAGSNPQFAVNVEYLRKAQPKDLEASEIDVRLGATWIPVHHIQDFMHETFQTSYWMRRAIQVNFSQYTGEWQITGKSQPSAHDVSAYVTYGTDRANAYKILEETLNLKAVQIYDTVEDMDGKEKRVLNKKETTLAQQKQQAIKDAFADWIWKDPKRREELVALYNERFNSVRPREYDGSHLQFVGMNPEISLRPHQLGAIAHVIYGGNTLLAHEVGAGKTFEMIASAMESKRLGLCQKSMFVVPNHLTLQWANEFLRLYPSAKILVTSAKDFETARRKKFCSRIATGDYDAVIIGHSQFERIPISPQRQERLLEQQLNDIQAGIDELSRSHGERFSIKQLEKTKRSVKARLEKIQGMDRKDDVIYFEQLGIDRLFVDESQAYKNRAKRCA